MNFANEGKTTFKKDVKILVVDDRDDNLFSIEAILERDNYKIVKANSGRAALKILLTEHDFSLILMDVQMPDINGLETATMIYEREKLKNIPIIFITAHDYDEDHMFKGYKMGGVDYISKPINPELLRVKVAVFVDLYLKTQQLVQQEKKLLATNRYLQREIDERIASEEKVRLLNEQLVQNNAHLVQANEELDRFAYMASHDLQEPLRKIMLFADKIQGEKFVDKESGKYFTKIINASRRMQTLINDLLSFSRQSLSTADFKDTDLNVLMKEVLNELELEIEKTWAEIKLGELPTVYAAPVLMRQLFLNLISNALKFRKPGIQPVVTISAEKNKPAKTSAFMRVPYHQVVISDNGIGFDPKYADEIFMVFKRLHSHHEFEGTGVGLSICKKIVERHGGHISAKSKPGEGSTFIIQLPVKPPSL
jgi:signal transduction histidine kinase